MSVSSDINMGIYCAYGFATNDLCSVYWCYFALLKSCESQASPVNLVTFVPLNLKFTPKKNSDHVVFKITSCSNNIFV